MQANNIDNDSGNISDTQGGDVPRLGNAAVHELKQTRAAALRDIDEGHFSCVASLSLSLLLPCLFTVTALYCKAGFILNYALSPAQGFSGTRESSSPFMSCLLFRPHLRTSRYDIFAINLASVMLGYIYGHTPGAALTQNAASCI